MDMAHSGNDIVEIDGNRPDAERAHGRRQQFPFMARRFYKRLRAQIIHRVSKFKSF